MGGMPTSLPDLTGSHRLRGTGGDLLIMEEAAFIAQEVWEQVVIPLIEVKNTALVAISTPLDSTNFYSTLVGMKDDNGDPVFDVLQAQAACAACVEQLEDPSKCPHVQLERPSWKSKEKQQVVKALYEGNQQTMMRESLGIVTESSGGVFMRKCINTMFETPRAELTGRTKQVYVAIDPSGGGGSNFAICSLYREDGRVVVVGLEDVRVVGHADMEATVLRHVRGLEILFPRHTGTKFVIMTESNLGLEAAHVANMLKDNHRCVPLRETGPEGRYGVLTTHARKAEFVALLETLLTTNAIVVGRQVVSTDADTALKTLEQQMQQYKMVTQTGGVFAVQRITFSGKLGADGKPGLMRDDLCIALQMAVYWSSYVIQRKCKFLDYAALFSAGRV